ncbi:uncharacterized protein LOC135701127 [Ochlerotatus camptorhynchus]|uniref:uncharacterized protein LOC135701127 n=1 Tax=Ochlerotatus camptorhynchus TaxID=644619 RepID=UPI0031DFDFFD
MLPTTKVQYDVEGGVLKRNRCSSRVYQAVLYGVLLAVVVIGWVVYRQGEVLLPKKQIACQSTTPSIEELSSTTPETIRIKEESHISESSTVGTTTESIDASGLIDSLLSPFVQSESAIVELTLDTDGFSIKFGENENSLTKLSKDSELSALFGLALQELLSLGQDETSGRRVSVDSVMEPAEATTTTTEGTTVEEILSWSSGNVMGFKFRYEDDHWELDVASELRSSEEVASEERSSNESAVNRQQLETVLL